jgi:hypothetical protein
LAFRKAFRLLPFSKRGKIGGGCCFFADAATPGATIGFRNGIIARSFGPSCLIELDCSALRLARKFRQPFSFSSIQAFAKLPSRISASGFFIASRVSCVTMRGSAW